MFVCFAALGRATNDLHLQRETLRLQSTIVLHIPVCVMLSFVIDCRDDGRVGRLRYF